MKTGSSWLEPKTSGYQHPLDQYHPLVARRLEQLGLFTQQNIDEFLDENKYIPSKPSEIPGLMEITSRLENSIARKEKVCVWGDYDVDGQTATTILFLTINELGGSATFHIPVRSHESHGLNKTWLSKLADQGVKVILTCAIGVTSVEEVAFAESLGLEVLITDHHDLPEIITKEMMIMSPKFLPPGHKLEYLCGAGLAYKLAEELYARHGAVEQARKFLDLVALGLIADQVILLRENRYLVQCGLQALETTERLGLKLLLEGSDLDLQKLNEDQIGYQITSKLNALGKLDDANLVVELFTTNDSSRARIIVTMVEGLFSKQQLLIKQITGAAKSLLEKDPSLLTRPVIFLESSTWPASLIGAVAGKLADQYLRPVVIITTPKNQFARGSTHSIEGINITSAISEHADLLYSYRGNAFAGGLSIENSNIEEFKFKLEKTIGKMMEDQKVESIIQIDGICTLEDLNLSAIEAIEFLEPFGPGNPVPILAIKGVRVIKTSRIGRQKEHTKFVIEDAQGNQATILWWGEGEVVFPEEEIDLACKVRISNWKGENQLQLECVYYRTVEGGKNHSAKKMISIIDHRKTTNRDILIKELPIGSVVWIEGIERQVNADKIRKLNPGIIICDRTQLSGSQVMVIITPPASPDVLKAAMEIVKPEQVILLCNHEPKIEMDHLLRNLAGLLKFVIKNKGGRTFIVDLCAATGQRITTISYCLEWFQLQGKIEIIFLVGDIVQIKEGSSFKDTEKANKLWFDIKKIVDETNAYRKYFQSTDGSKLIESNY